MHNRNQPHVPRYLRVPHVWGIIVFVIALVVIGLMMPFQPNTPDGKHHVPPEADTLIDGHLPTLPFGDGSSGTATKSSPIAGFLTDSVGKQRFLPEADTFIDGNEPNRNFGNAASISVKNTPPMAGWLRFAVVGAPQDTPVRAQLRLFVTDGSNGVATTVYAFSTSPAWDERQLTWNSQLAFGNQVGASSVRPLAEGQWVEINLGPIISGDAIYSFAITSDSMDRVGFAARSEANWAQLVIGMPENTPVQTQTATPSTAQTIVQTMTATNATATNGTSTSSDITPMPTNGTTIPADETAVPPDETAVPPEETAVPPEETTQLTSTTTL